MFKNFFKFEKNQKNSFFNNKIKKLTFFSKNLKIHYILSMVNVGFYALVYQ